MKLSEVDRSKLAPMMRHYAELKDNYQDVILFYRLGDFYDLFNSDMFRPNPALFQSRQPKAGV